MMHKISGAYDHISIKAVGFIDGITDKGFRDQAVVQVSKVNNGETIELRRQIWNRNPIPVHLNQITLSQQVSEQRHNSKSSS